MPPRHIGRTGRPFLLGLGQLFGGLVLVGGDGARRSGLVEEPVRPTECTDLMIVDLRREYPSSRQQVAYRLNDGDGAGNLEDVRDCH